jgi:hypothetical protein
MFDEATLLREAARIAGCDDFGGEQYRPALAALLTSFAQDLGAHEMGAQVFPAGLVQSLVNRAWGIETLRGHPEIGDIAIDRPIIITGVFRTGTTLLQRLLAADPQNRAPVLWELMSPVDPPGADSAQVRPQMMAPAETFVGLVGQAAPEIHQLMHPSNARWPEEDEWLMRSSFMNPTLGWFFYLPSYMAWLEQQDMGPAYRHWRRQLQLLLWRIPGQNLVLKNPNHLFALDALAAVMPDALVVHLHRDMREVVPSLCSLMQALHGLTRPRPDNQSVGAYATTLMHGLVNRMLEFRRGPHALEIMDVPYRTLVQDPLAVVRQIYERLGRTMNEPGARAMQAWLADNPQHKGGMHRYTLEQFHLDPVAIDRLFQPYTDRFIEQAPGQR